MRIALFLPWPGIGGTEYSTTQLATYLLARNHVVTVYHLPEAEKTAALLASSGVPTAQYRPEFPSYRHPFNYLRATLPLVRDLKQRRVQIIHCADLLAAYHTVLASRLAGIPMVSHIRCMFDRISERDQSFLWWVQRFIFISKAVRDGFAYRDGATRGDVIYTGFSVPVFDRAGAAADLRREFGIAPDEAVIGMVARIAELKDFHTLIRAAQLLGNTHRKARFLLVGDYTQPQQQVHYAQVKAWLKEYGVEQNFVFTGHRAEATRMLAGMDISVLCTHSEGFGRVVVEAMAQGTPVVGTAIDGVMEIIEHGSNGLLHKHKDHEDLARNLQLLLDDRAYCSRIAEAGQRDAVDRFGSEAFVSRVEEVYRRLLGVGQAKPR